MKLMEAFPSSALEIKPRSALSLFQCSSLPSKPGMKKGLCSTPVTRLHLWFHPSCARLYLQGRHRGDQMELMLFNSPGNTSLLRRVCLCWIMSSASLRTELLQ